MKTLLVTLFFLLSQVARADGGNLSLQCREIVQGKQVIILTGNQIKFDIVDPYRTCESLFEYERLQRDDGAYLITSWPENDELGINAQRHLYIALSANSEARFVGAVPVEASVIDEGVYRSVSQVGGSIFETIYSIDNGAVSIKKPTKELIISDTKCVYAHEGSDACLDMTGTFDKPVCVYSVDEKKILADISECSDLQGFGG